MFERNVAEPSLLQAPEWQSDTLLSVSVGPAIAYGPRHEKTCFSHMRTTKAQISLHIVVRCLHSIISLVSIFKIASF